MGILVGLMLVPYIIFLIVLTIITSIIAIIKAIKSKYNNETYFNKKLSTITAIICFILQVYSVPVCQDNFFSKNSLCIA